MYGKERRDAAKFDGKIAIADGIQRVLRDFGPTFMVHKAEQLGDQLALKRKRRTGDSAAAERANIDPGKTLAQALVVARQHFDVGQQVMHEIDRLSPLQVSIAGNDGLDFLRAKFNECLLKRADIHGKTDDLLAQPEPHVQRDLIDRKSTR